MHDAFAVLRCRREGNLDRQPLVRAIHVAERARPNIDRDMRLPALRVALVTLIYATGNNRLFYGGSNKIGYKPSVWREL
jgi:hypothetical protein